MKTLIHQNQSEIFGKIVRKNGRSFLVRFVILESCGKLRGKIISCEPITVLDDAGPNKVKYCLPLLGSTQILAVEKAQFQKIISSFSKLEFLTSIQIRAPAHTE